MGRGGGGGGQRALPLLVSELCAANSEICFCSLLFYVPTHTKKDFDYSYRRITASSLCLFESTIIIRFAK